MLLRTTTNEKQALCARKPLFNPPSLYQDSIYHVTVLQLEKKGADKLS